MLADPQKTAAEIRFVYGLGGWAKEAGNIRWAGMPRRELLCGYRDGLMARVNLDGIDRDAALRVADSLIRKV